MDAVGGAEQHLAVTERDGATVEKLDTAERRAAGRPDTDV
jgi:hypothetical protein